MDDDRPLFFHVMAYADDADHDVIDMVSGDPDWEPPTALREGLREFADAPVADYQYPPSEGRGDLRDLLADRHDVPVERLVVTNGGGEANHLAMACGLEAHAGNEVILTDPVYPYYADRAELLGADVTYAPVADDGALDPETVRAVASEETALIVACSPNNPTGAVYGESVKRELTDIAEANDALYVSDEVYEAFDFSGRFHSALAFDSENVAVTNSFSKAMATTGLRVGYAILPDHLVDPVRTRHMLTNVAVTAPGQHAALKALRETPDDYYAETRAMLESRIEHFCEALDAAGAEYIQPQGAFYVLARFDGFPGTLDNTKRLIDEAGVAGMPGDAFGSAREEWLRFALVSPRADEAADRLAAYFS
ncbi:pyridoxal phosphate-dependent aminotransferase [Halosegnis longus]|uniref:Pyridoxal phosphate-dependent aminotransferase n=1 Tax=Halosegnis longus TaxID=2216012 RepID=A0AAJ4UWL8_9EURY|nr:MULTISPECIES: pyridoxal phosphate-dependent aminotransferase [Halobacteriales]RNJ27050.1 pyridoxal phosphate-dependent aminotransferase [Salella cibi]